MKCGKCDQEFDKDVEGAQIIQHENEEIGICPTCFKQLQQAYQWVKTPAGRAEVRRRQRKAEKRKEKRARHR